MRRRTPTTTCASPYLATVLFLVGISGHFRLKAARYGLVTVGVIVLVLAVANAHDPSGPT